MQRTISVLLTANVTSFATRMRAAAGSVKELDDAYDRLDASSKRGVASLSKVAAGIGVGLGAAVGAAVVASTRFEKEMSNVGAVTGATARQLDVLRESAIKAGADTVFSAREAAQAQSELGKAGMSVADIVSGGVTAALNLASAGQLDLATAASYTANAMNIFRLRGSEAGYVADVLAAGANKADGGVHELGQAMQQGGLMAAQMGMSLDETVALLAMFAQNGLLGSDAGTSMKTMLQRLVPQGDEARAMMQQLGIEMFDANGKFIGVRAAAEELRTGLMGLSDEQRSAALTTIYGSDAIRAATIVAKEGAAGFDAWNAKVMDQGYAAELAAKKLDNLAGDLEQLKGSIETALIQSGSGANGVLRELVQGVTDVVNAFGGLPDPAQAAVTGFVGISGASLLVASGVGMMLPHLRTTKDLLTNMGPAGATAAGALGAIGRVAGGAGLVVGLAVAIRQLQDQIHGVKDANVAKLTSDLINLAQTGQVGGNMARVFGRDLSGLASDLERVESRSGGVGGALRYFGDQLAGTEGQTRQASKNIDGIDKALAAIVSSGNAELTRVALDYVNDQLVRQGSSLARLMPELNEYRAARDRQAAADKLGAIATDRANQAMGQTPGATDRAKEALKAYWESVREGIGASFSSLMPDDAISTIQQSMAEAANAAMDLGRKRAKAAKSTKTAEEREIELAQAYIGIERAEMRVISATDELNKLRSDFASSREVARLEREIAAAIDSSERAYFRLLDAQKALDDLRRGPTARSVEEAEIALGRALNSQAEAAEALVRANEKLAMARDHGSPEELAQSERELQEALWKQKEASWAVGDAQTKLNELRSGADSRQLREAELDLAEAGREVANSHDQTREANDALIEARRGSNAMAIREAELSLKEAVLGVRQAHAQLAQTQRGEAKDAMDELAGGGMERVRVKAEDMRASLEQVEAHYRQQIETALRFNDNLIWIAQNGPPALALQLSTMGEEGMRVAQMLRGRMPSELDEMWRLLEGRAMLGSKTWQEIVAEQLGKGRDAAKTITHDMVVKMAEELNWSVEQARAILESWGFEVGTKLEPWMQLRNRMVPGRFHAEGAVVDYYAGGGTRENHVAQIAPAGAWRVWAEPETGGEAYIPMAKAKEARSVKILKLVARHFGLDVHDAATAHVHDYHEGGLALPPEFENVRALVRPQPLSTAWVMYLAAQQAHEDFHRRMPAGAGPGGGNIVAVGRQMQAMGYRVGEHPAFGGVAPVHTRNSYHYRGRALDVNWLPAAQEPAKLDQLHTWIRKTVSPITELLWRTKGHHGHLHLAMAKGGILTPTSYDQGGTLPPHSATLAVNNTAYHEPVGRGGRSVSITYAPNVDVDARIGVGADMDWAARAIRDQVEDGVRSCFDDLDRQITMRVDS